MKFAEIFENKNILLTFIIPLLRPIWIASTSTFTFYITASSRSQVVLTSSKNSSKKQLLVSKVAFVFAKAFPNGPLVILIAIIDLVCIPVRWQVGEPTCLRKMSLPCHLLQETRMKHKFSSLLKGAFLQLLVY